MVIFPNCKINLGLRILRKRTDGFHDLQTVFYPLALKDALEIINDDKLSTNQFTQSGLKVDGNASDNLCIKAYDLLKKDFPSLPSLKIHLHKNIPMGAGLGGGSSDGSFTLKLLNSIFELNISEEKLIGYALQLGSDCPFFIINKPCLATGRGENLKQINVDLSPYSIVVINPGIHINTGWAFSQLHPRENSSIEDIITQPIEKWKDNLINDFEEPVFEKYPEIRGIKETLYRQGAIYASMTGSGSTVYGLFRRSQNLSLGVFEKESYRVDIIK